MANSILIMDGNAMARALRRIAHEILEHNPDPATFALVAGNGFGSPSPLISTAAAISS